VSETQPQATFNSEASSPPAGASPTPDLPPAPDAIAEPQPPAGGATAVEPPASSPAHMTPRAAAGSVYWGTGRRKSAVARVRLIPGSGKVLINQRELERYFTEIKDRQAVVAPLELTGQAKRWDVLVNVRGGGFTGQAGAIRLGVARALLAADSSCEATLRDAGHLTRDARRVERKKPGRRKARRRFQFSKR